MSFTNLFKIHRDEYIPLLLVALLFVLFLYKLFDE